MKHLVTLFSILAIAASAQPVAKPSPEKAPAAKKYVAPRTPDGQPDFQGVWSNATVTPLERPADLAGKEFFTLDEAAKFERSTVSANNADRRESSAAADVARAYNDFWYNRGDRVVRTLRTSLIVDPQDGRLPALTPEAQKRQDDLRAYNRDHPADGPENRGNSERCLAWATAGPPMMPSAYNNNYQVIQSRGYFAIVNEMIHDTRVIPLDGRQHLESGMRQWFGDSRGHWEGDTLVIDTVNFTDKTRFRGASQNMHLTERFTRTGPDTLLYQFTVDDPSSFTSAWTGEIPSWRSQDMIYEYACHEGNYGMEGILAGARNDDKAEASKK